MKVLILIRKWYDSRLKYSFMTILWLVLDSKFALRKYFDYSHTLSDFSLNINFSIWLQLTLKPSWFIKVYNVWLFLTIADYFWLFLTFMRKFLTQNLSLAEVIFWILGGLWPIICVFPAVMMIGRMRNLEWRRFQRVHAGLGLCRFRFQKNRNSDSLTVFGLFSGIDSGIVGQKNHKMNRKWIVFSVLRFNVGPKIFGKVSIMSS